VALDLPVKNCKWQKCRKSFKPKRQKQEFCQPKCRGDYHRSFQLKPDATCPHCGQPIFRSTPDSYGRGRQAQDEIMESG